MALTLAIAGVALAACGGGGDDDSSAAVDPPGSPPSSPSPPGGNSAPTISGAPQSSVLQDSAFSFTPSASDANGDVLTFSIVNKPAWATFTPATGRLEGTPGAADIGSYADVRISVTDGELTANLPAFTVNVVATAVGSATLSWTPPNQNTDGSALSDLAGFKVYWGRSQGSYQNSTQIGAGITSYMVEQLTAGTWYFAVTTLNSQGVESAFTNMVSKTIQ